MRYAAVARTVVLSSCSLAVSTLVNNRPGVAADPGVGAPVLDPALEGATGSSYDVRRADLRQVSVRVAVMKSSRAGTAADSAPAARVASVARVATVRLRLHGVGRHRLVAS